MIKESGKTDRLLERGCESYLDALRALREFRKEVLDKSMSAMAQKLDNISEALGVGKLDPKKVSLYEEPKLEPGAPWQEDWAELGAQLWFGDYDCSFHAGLQWKRRESTEDVDVWAQADVWVKKARYTRYWPMIQSFVGRKRTKLGHHPPDLVTDGTFITLRESCPAGEIGDLSAKLRRLLDGWCLIWKKTGGLAIIKKRP
jgi:hypothetical protein